MYSAFATFIDRLDSWGWVGPNVIAWGCPVPFFGDFASARVATVGINPSNREFVDRYGVALPDSQRRFPTLRSLELARWSDAEASHLRQIVDACTQYFEGNPYDTWFRVLDQVLAPAGGALYGHEAWACHLDLVPYATERKWGSLPSAERQVLLDAASDVLGLLFQGSLVEWVILNGQSVVEHFEVLTGVRLEIIDRRDWALPRRRGSDIPGRAYLGEVDQIGGVLLSRPVRVAGYNHNLQSSFGVTRQVVARIGEWIAEHLAEGRSHP